MARLALVVLLALGIGALDASVASAAIGDEALGVSVDLSPAVQNGGDGTAVVRPAEVTASAVPVSDLRLTIAASRVARLRVASAGPWLCSRAVGRRIDCRLSGSTRAPPPLAFRIDLGAGRRFGSGTVVALVLAPAWPCQAHAGPAGSSCAPPPFGHGGGGRRARQRRAAWPGRPAGDPAGQRRAPDGGADPIRLAPAVPQAGSLHSGALALDARRRTDRRRACRVVRRSTRGSGPDASVRAVRVGRPRACGRDDGRPCPATSSRATRSPAGLDPPDRPALPGLQCARHARRARARRPSGGAHHRCRRHACERRRAVRLQIVVHGQRARSVRWSMLIGPGAVLTDAQRRGATIAFRAPATPGTYMLQAVVLTAAGRFVRDETLIVEPGVRAAADRSGPAPRR